MPHGFPVTRRTTFTRARRIAGYSWPLYAFAAGALGAGSVVASLQGILPLLRGLAAIAALAAGWFATASFLAFHWMFDRSELTRWAWVARELPQPPARWVQMNAGLEETFAPLHDVFPGAEGRLLDVYDPSFMTEPAITRARQGEAATPATPARPQALPVEDGWADLVLVVLVAHEIRNAAARGEFFRELTRTLSPKGRIILVEHLRDAAGALAFGPGVFHFLPRREWLRQGERAGLALEREFPITPFVRVFVYRAAPPTSAASSPTGT